MNDNGLPLATLRGAWLESKDTLDAHQHSCRRWDNCRTCDSLSRKEIAAFDIFVNAVPPTMIQPKSGIL